MTFLWKSNPSRILKSCNIKRLCRIVLWNEMHLSNFTMGKWLHVTDSNHEQMIGFQCQVQNSERRNISTSELRRHGLGHGIFSTGISYFLRKSFLLSEKINLVKINRNIFWVESRVNDIFPIYFFGLSDPWNSRLKFRQICIQCNWNPRWFAHTVCALDLTILLVDYNPRVLFSKEIA